MTLVALVAAMAPIARGADVRVTHPAPARPAARNVIMLMADGCANSAWTTVRWVKGGPLAMDDCLTGAVRSYNAESIVTDSGPASTAFACGIKGSDKTIGVTPCRMVLPTAMAIRPADVLRPVASILEGAGSTAGRPGSLRPECAARQPRRLRAHTANRYDNQDIAEQQAYAGVDVVFGGGVKYMLPAGGGGVRTDDQDLMDVLKSQAVQLVSTRLEMEQLKTGPAWGLFAPDAMAYDWDRALLRPSEPSLAEMTAKAIELLNQDPDGFFLFVEGSKVDWAAHANDPAGLLSDALAFDAAVEKGSISPAAIAIRWSWCSPITPRAASPSAGKSPTVATRPRRSNRWSLRCAGQDEQRRGGPAACRRRDDRRGDDPPGRR